MNKQNFKEIKGTLLQEIAKNYEIYPHQKLIEENEIQIPKDPYHVK